MHGHKLIKLYAACSIQCPFRSLSISGKNIDAGMSR